MNKQVFIFDADGVLCNPPMQFAAYLLTKGISRETTREFFAKAFVPCLIGEADTKEVLKPFLTKWGWNDSVDAFIQDWHREEHVLEPELVKLIVRLRSEGYLVCLATNQDSYRATYMRQKMGVEELFSRCYFSSAIGAIKPDRAYFDHITADLGVEPSAIWFFDDEERYVNGAKNAGWNGHVYVDAVRTAATISGVIREVTLYN